MPLDTLDQNRIKEFYEESFKEFGDRDARSLHWSDKDGQITRFNILLNIANITGASLLDVGCGFGDLYKYLLERQIDANYTGIDIIPEFIATAKTRYPDATFECKDIFDCSRHFDCIFASGALSFKVKDNNNYYRSMIKKMYDLADRAVAFNMLNSTIHVDDSIYASYSPDEIGEFCKTFCDDVEIVVGYLPQDFTIYLHKTR